MAKFKLELDPDPEVTIIGISSHVHDYRLCWSINRTMHIALARRKVDIADGDGKARYAAFDHVDDPTNGRVTLVSNHGEEGKLLKDQRHADYFLVVDNELAERTPDLLDRLRGAEFVLTAFPLPFTQLRTGHKLLL